MENIFYFISAHSTCIEGVRLTKKNNQTSISNKIEAYKITEDADSSENNSSDLERWGQNICGFLDRNQWDDHSISFLMPAEDITFRKLNYPFQESKKVLQALPFDLEEELIGNLNEFVFASEVQPLADQDSEALILLMDQKKLELLQQIALDRDLLIRNVDCTSHALYRSLMTTPSQEILTKNIFQIYIGADEAFLNTVCNGRLNEIKIFPNQISSILLRQLTSKPETLTEFLGSFAKHHQLDAPEESELEEEIAFSNIKQELQWLCAQLTRHLRIKHYNSESEIQLQGIFGAVIEWDGIRLKIREFPLPEVNTFLERVDLHKNGDESENLESDGAILPFDEEEDFLAESPDTLEELLEKARKREKIDLEEPINDSFVENQQLPHPPMLKENSTNLTKINSQSSLLSLSSRKMWGIMGELIDHAENFIEPHALSLYHEVTPWRRFIRRNKGAATFMALMMILLITGFAGQTWLKLNLFQKEIARQDNLIQKELKQILPNSSAKSVQGMLAELKEKVRQREAKIEISKSFNQRNYHNLSFLKKLSMLLDEGAPFQVDSLEYAPERFSLSGTIDSYDSLQLLKTNLKDLDEFKEKQIVESNRKSQEGIVYRISIDLTTKTEQ